MKILITGGTGSLGQALVAHWHDKHDLRILSRNPHRQQMVQEKFNLDPSAFILADICDYDAVRRACIGQDILIHAAALKVVAQGEQFPEEYFRVNALGSHVVARAWADVRGISDGHPYAVVAEPRRALYINSDKSVSPVNLYGNSKKIGEAIFTVRGFSSIRYGNVVKSEGSFIHKWERARTKGLPIKLRFPNPTRYILSFQQAIALIDSALDAMTDRNGVFVPHSMEAFSLADVAEAMTAPANICHEMLEPGEKQHETLLQEGERAAKVNDLLSLVRPGRFETLPPQYSSETAKRLDAAEVLRRLNISPLQEVFS